MKNGPSCVSQMMYELYFLNEFESSECLKLLIQEKIHRKIETFTSLDWPLTRLFYNYIHFQSQIFAFFRFY